MPTYDRAGIQPVEGPTGVIGAMLRANESVAAHRATQDAERVILDPKASDMQKAIAWNKLNPQAASALVKSIGSQQNISTIESNLQNRLNKIRGGSNLSNMPNIPTSGNQNDYDIEQQLPAQGNQAPTIAQPGEEGTPTQRPFTVGGPQNASRNQIRLTPQAPPMMLNAPQGSSQVSQMDPREQALAEADAFDDAASAAAKDGNVALQRDYQAKADQRRKDIREGIKADRKEAQDDKKQVVKIHTLEKPAYDSLEKDSQQAKKTMRARKTMVDQLPHLNNKNWKNLLANVFKDRPLLEGLFSTPEREIFKSAGITQFEGMKEVFGVRLSDADLAVAATKVMSPEKSPEANRAIAEFWDFSDKMKVEEANIAREIKKQNGGFLPIDWRERTHDIMQERFGDEAERITKAAANEGGSKPLKVVNGKVEIITPDGPRVWVPENQIKTALLNGGIAV